MNDNSKMDLIYQIANACNLKHSVQIFTTNKDKLKGYKFIFASKKGSQPGHAVSFNFKNGSVIRGLFKTENVYLLDEKTLEEMYSNESKFPIDYSISLDTQALSYLQPYIERKNNSRLPKDFKEIFTFIARDDVNVDPLPYEFENHSNLESSSDKIFEKLKAYQILRTIDSELLLKHDLIESTLSHEELIKVTQEHLSRLFYNSLNLEVLDDFLYDIQYIHLLKMIIIQFEHTSLSSFKKTIKHLDFCHYELANIGIKEVLLSRKYFEEGQNFLFFSKIQRNKTDKSKFFRDIKGMAWDLYHIRQMERLITITPDSRARYFFPALLTCDKRLKDILDLFSIKCIVFNNLTNDIIPFYELDLFTQLSSTPSEKYLIENYFLEDKKKDRSERLQNSTNNLSILIESLENELFTLAFDN